MKIFNIVALITWCLTSSGLAFTVVPQHRVQSKATCHFMFSGSGTMASGDDEDDPVALERLEKEAKALGMPLPEYKLSVKSRNRLLQRLTEFRTTAGKSATVTVERDGHNPSRYFDITITEAGKKLGKETLSKELVAAMKTAADSSRNARQEAQKDMAAYIQEELKRMGA